MLSSNEYNDRKEALENDASLTPGRKKLALRLLDIDMGRGRPGRVRRRVHIPEPEPEVVTVEVPVKVHEKSWLGAALGLGAVVGGAGLTGVLELIR